MAATEKTVRMAAKLYEMRDLAKRLLGDRYSEEMGEIRKIIKGVQSGLKLNEPLVAATRICTANSLGGVDAALIMAAAVEMVEPSVEQQTGSGRE